MRILKALPGLDDANVWQRALDGLGSGDAPSKLLKRSLNVEVVRATLDVGRGPEDLVIKTEPAETLSDRLRVRLGSSRLHRHWENAQWLHRREAFPTAECLALLGSRSLGKVWQITLVARGVPGRSLLQVLADAAVPVRTQHRVAEAVARQTKAMFDAGLVNRDHKPSNLIVSDGEQPTVTLIDVVGIYSRSTPSDEARLHLGLMLEAIGTGHQPRRALIARYLRTWFGPQWTKGQRRKLWRDIEQRIIDHGDPTPKDNPLDP